MPHIRTAVNRAVLGAVGLVLLGTGSWLAAADRAVVNRMPSWWPAPGPGTVLLDRDRPAQLRGEGWWTLGVTAAAIALTVLFASWFLAQLHSGRARRLALPSPGATVRPQALAEALATRVSALPGVARSRARVLPRPGRRLDFGLRLWLEPGTPPEAVLPTVCAVAAEAERSTAPYTAHTRVRLSAASHRVPRVR
ncbi:hypothetical protein OK074_0225 [Actinobacteria bacterium OK074]|nr:hypothetical protein OK074_0225 [Actinobacteria bacterium OK074]